MKRILSALICIVILIGLLPVSVFAAEDIKTLNIRIKDPVASYSPGLVEGMDSNVSNPMSEFTKPLVTWEETYFHKTLTLQDSFVAGLPYKVTITLIPMVNSYFALDIYGQLAANITINNRPATVEKCEWRNGKIDSITVSYQYEALSGMEISSVLVKGIPTPVAGNMPIYSFTLGTTKNLYGFYHTEPITWYDENDKKFLSSGDTFIKGHRYRLQIWLAANRSQGYTFKLDSSGNPAVDATLNSFAAHSVITAYEQDPREVISISYLFPACQEAHTCAPKLVPQQNPTCLLPGFKAYYECSCGKCFEDAAGKKVITDMDGYGILPASGHKEGSWSYNGTHHYKKCTTCLEIIPGTNAAHSGGKATCIAKGTCTICGYDYQQPNENHTPDTKWTACGNLYHAYLCKLCGAHCNPQDHTPGPAATETTPQTCKVCGYVIAPAKNHKHTIKAVEATAPTCTRTGNKAYYMCTSCENLFTDKDGKTPLKNSVLLAATGHTAAKSWKTDKAQHWKICASCQTVMPETKEDHKIADEKCSTCGYIVSTGKIDPAVAETTEATLPTENTLSTETDFPTEETGFPTEETTLSTETTDITDPTQITEPTDVTGSENNHSWLTVVLVALVCFAAAITATVIILKMKKKTGEQP